MLQLQGKNVNKNVNRLVLTLTAVVPNTVVCTFSRFFIFVMKSRLALQCTDKELKS